MHLFAVLHQQLCIGQKRGTHRNEFSKVIHRSQRNRLEISQNIRCTWKMRLEGTKKDWQVLRNNRKEHFFLMFEMPVERTLRKSGFPCNLFRGHTRKSLQLNKPFGCIQNFLSCFSCHTSFFLW